jgi:hypothetical protein
MTIASRSSSSRFHPIVAGTLLEPSRSGISVLAMLQLIAHHLRQQPFVPFEVRCSNKQSFQINSPDYATVFHDFLIIRLPVDGGIIMLHQFCLSGVVVTRPASATPRPGTLRPRFDIASPQPWSREDAVQPRTGRSLVVGNIF